jgi:hypothetical protein
MKKIILKSLVISLLAVAGFSQQEWVVVKENGKYVSYPAGCNQDDYGSNGCESYEMSDDDIKQYKESQALKMDEMQDVEYAYIYSQKDTVDEVTDKWGNTVYKVEGEEKLLTAAEVKARISSCGVGTYNDPLCTGKQVGSLDSSAEVNCENLGAGCQKVAFSQQYIVNGKVCSQSPNPDDPTKEGFVCQDTRTGEENFQDTIYQHCPSGDCPAVSKEEIAIVENTICKSNRGENYEVRDGGCYAKNTTGVKQPLGKSDASTEAVSQTTGTLDPVENPNSPTDPRNGAFKNLLAGKKASKKHDTKIMPGGSARLKQCQKYIVAAGHDFKTIVKESDIEKNALYSIFASIVRTKMKESEIMDEGDAFLSSDKNTAIKEYEKLTQNLNDPKSIQKLNAIKEELEGVYASSINDMRECLAYMAVLKENFKSGEDIKSLRKRPKIASMDKKIACYSAGIETIDYDECENLKNAQDAALMTLKANDVYQKFEASEFAHEQQMKLIQANSGDGSKDVTTMALKSQKEALEEQKKMAETNQALHAAKLTAMLSFGESLIDYEELNGLCASSKKVGTWLTEKDKSPQIEAFDKLLVTGSPDTGSAESLCETGLAHIQDDIIPNQAQKIKARQIAAEAGIDVMKNVMAADMLEDQADMVDATINKINNYEVTDLPNVANMTQDQLRTFCEVNPNHPECGTGFGGGNSTQITNPGGLVFTGGLDGSNELNIANDGEAGPVIDTADGDQSTATDSKRTPTSRAVANTNTKGGLADPSPSAAKVTQGGPNGGGGGAGGGGVSSGGGISGGGDGGPTGPGGLAPSDTKRFKNGYIGGGRSLAFTGGRGNRGSSSKSKKDFNPFAKMFKKGGKNGKVVNFRDLASSGKIGGRRGNIFDRITNRYGVVQKRNDLLKYEDVSRKDLDEK